MSLDKAVLEIADEMEKDANDYKKANADIAAGLVLSWSRQLKRIVKASEPPPKVYASPSTHLNFDPDPPELINHLKKTTTYHETHVENMILLVGGDMDGTTAPFDVNAPVGAKTLLAGQVYVKKDDGKLHYSPEETKAFRDKRA